MKAMTVTKNLNSVLLYIFKFYDSTKFHYHQLSRGKVLSDKNFEVFLLLITLRDKSLQFHTVKRPSNTLFNWMMLLEKLITATTTTLFDSIFKVPG